MKHVFIINPMAGKPKDLHGFIQSANHVISELDETFVALQTQYPGHAVTLVKEFLPAVEMTRFYACGGDGTMNEVLHGIFGQENCELAVIPMGSGNDFLRCFGEVKDFLDLENQAHGQAISVDILQAGDHVALNLINVGLDAETAFYKNKFQRLPGVSGPMAYYLALAFCFFRRYGIKLDLELDDLPHVEPKGYILTAFGNGTTYGSGFRATPLATPVDGIMDVCLFRHVSRPVILKYLPFFKRGEHVNHPGLKDILYYDKHKKVRISGNHPLHICMDGEFFDSQDVTINVVPKAIRFVVPKGMKPQWPLT
jgi:YegS/Rv2252/BmrU family lipid kinase